MAPRAIWKGHLKLALIVCPVALYKATSDFEGVEFSSFVRKTGNKVRQLKTDAGTGEIVESEDIARGYNVGTSKEPKFLEITDEEIEACAPASARVIEIAGFVAPESMTLARFPLVEEHLFMAPDGAAAAEAFALVNAAMTGHAVMGIATMVRGARERLALLIPCGRAMAVTVLRDFDELRNPAEVQPDVDVVVPRDLRALTGKIVDATTIDFDPAAHTDRYTAAIRELVTNKIAGKMIKPAKNEEPPRMADLASAVRKSVESARPKRKSA